MIASEVSEASCSHWLNVVTECSESFLWHWIIWRYCQPTFRIQQSKEAENLIRMVRGDTNKVGALYNLNQLYLWGRQKYISPWFSLLIRSMHTSHVESWGQLFWLLPEQVVQMMFNGSCPLLSRAISFLSRKSVNDTLRRKNWLMTDLTAWVEVIFYPFSWSSYLYKYQGWLQNIPWFNECFDW